MKILVLIAALLLSGCAQTIAALGEDPASFCMVVTGGPGISVPGAPSGVVLWGRVNSPDAKLKVAEGVCEIETGK